MPAHEVAKRGLARTFQLVCPFMYLTTLDNLLTGSMGGHAGYLIFDPDWKTVVWNVAPVILSAEKFGFSGHVMPGKGEVHISKVVSCRIECK